MDKNWKLGEDVFPEDNMLDGITFQEVIMTVHCNCRDITYDAIRKEVLTLLEMRIEDMKVLMEKNLAVIAEEARKGRECQ